MAYFNPEPPKQDSQPRVGILLANLGTPDAPTAKALRPYLKEFLMDRRVIEIPRAIWYLILHCVILMFRPKKSAKKYSQIWSKEGSPLLVHGQKQAHLLAGYLGQKIQSPFTVELGMSYGKPNIKSAINKLKAQHCNKILVFPLYPQYAASSTAASLDVVWKALLKMRSVPAIRTVRSYHDHPAYIKALASSVSEYWMINGKPEKLVMSFHGVPKFHVIKGDPYHEECLKTAQLLTEALGLNEDKYEVAFQSRFGKQEWLKPYLAGLLKDLGKAKTKRIDVICPGFSSDCLETLEEIAIEGKGIFQNNGGGEYNYIPALNENDIWIRAMAQIAVDNMMGWVTPRPDTGTANRAKTLGTNQ